MTNDNLAEQCRVINTAEQSCISVKAILGSLHLELASMQVPPAGMRLLDGFKEVLTKYQDFIDDCHGKLFCGSAKTSGHERALVAVQQAYENIFPTLPGTIKSMIVRITASPDLTMNDYWKIEKFLREKNPDADLQRIGVTYNEEWIDAVEVTILVSSK